MFTGIIQEVGKVPKVKNKKDEKIFTIETVKILESKKIGDSIAINGACLTVTEIETLDLTNLSEIKENSEVNIEGALKMGQSLDGHIVQGHVDCIGKVLGWKKNVLQIKFPSKIQKYIALKGSITINGVSLTISKRKKEEFEVSLILHTIQNTNLGKLKKNDKVNLEIDIIARYLETLCKSENSVKAK